MAVYKVFIGGGGDDWISNIVKGYFEQYARSNPDYTCQYFSWTAVEDVNWHVRLLPDGSDVTIVGHSYGADCAFDFLPSLTKPVRTLITIDPVGRLRSSWSGIRSKCQRWLNVKAESNRPFEWSNLIARAGGTYPRPPAPGAAGAPDYSLIVNTIHANFYTMMRAPTKSGVSGKSLLGGNSVA